MDWMCVLEPPEMPHANPERKGTHLLDPEYADIGIRGVLVCCHVEVLRVLVEGVREQIVAEGGILWEP